MSRSVKLWVLARSKGWRCSRLSSKHCSLPPRRISPSTKKGLYRAILELFGNAEFFWRASSSGVKDSLCTTRMQYVRAAASSPAVSSPLDFPFRRRFCRNRRTQALVRISFQYELNLGASMRLALIAAVRTWRRSLFFSSWSDLAVAMVPDGQHSSLSPSQCGPCHQISSECIWFPSRPLERWSAGFSRLGQFLHCVSEVRD